MTTYEEVLSAVQQLTAEDKARLIEEIGAALRRDLTPAKAGLKHSLYGIFADLGSAPTAEDIDAARHELWERFPREDIG